MNTKISKQNWSKWHHIFHKAILSDPTFIPKGTNLLIAVSGGQDSMALLNLLHDIQGHHEWTIYVWHGDHKWHKKSKHFAEALKSYCKSKKIHFFLDEIISEDISSEDKARNWRYEKLYQKAEKLMSKKLISNELYILTGHTSTDNAETFLLNLARGSNYAGLGNIEKKRLLNNKFYLVRPLLVFSRKDTGLICKSLEIPIWEDPSNNDLSIKRNIIRKKVIPQLEGIYPGSSDRINCFSKKMNAFNKEQKDLCKLAISSCRKNEDNLKRELFNTLGKEARSTILNYFIKEFCSKQVNAKNIEKASDEIFQKEIGQINLPGNLKMVWTKKTIRFEN